MEANEAPEKIYLHPDIGGREFIRPWLKRRASQESVEYTRTDAFIEKAVEWLKENAEKYIWYSDYAENLGDDTCGMNDDFIEDFKKVMKL